MNLFSKHGTKIYNLVFALGALGLTVSASMFGGAYLPAIIGLFAAMANQVAFFLVILFTFQYFQGGTDLKINQKIFEEGNIAAAIYQASIVIAIAMLISGAIL
jgi:hypothetical protein